MNLIGYMSAEKTAYYRMNAHGDVVAVVDGFGETLKTYKYDAFGGLEEDGNEWLKILFGVNVKDSNPLRYCAEYYDEETEFIYLRARYYSPEIQRFISEDPIKDGINWYAYCGNNPIFFHDLTGYRRKPSVKRITESIETRANEHYKHNIELSFSGYIDNQYRGNAAKVKMGNPKFGSNACGWIAVYNSMLTLDEDVKVADIVMFYDSNPTKYMLMDGALGIKPSSFDVLFGNYGYNSNTIYFNTDDLDAKAQNADTAILCYFYYTEGVGAHYINLTWNSELDEYVVYNENGGNLKSINDFLEDNDYVFISLTTVEKEEENE